MNTSPEPVAKVGKTRCPYCGDSPVRHFTTYINETIATIYIRTVSVSLVSLFSAVSERSASIVARAFILFLRFFGAVSFESDMSKASSIRSRLIWQEASRRLIQMEQVVALGKPTEWYRARVNGRWHYFESIPLPHSFSHTAGEWIDDKHLLKERLRKAGIPAPRSFSVVSERGAEEAIEKISVPVVVKPRTGSRGRHTTPLVSDSRWVRRAFRRAREINHFVVVEEYLSGSVCRATLVTGVLRGFLRAEPPYVTGDGVKTVALLIAEKNATRPSRVAEVLVRPELIEFIGRQGYRLDSVLPRGMKLPLLFRTGRLFGGATREMLPEIHSKLRAVLERAAGVVRAPVVGFDLIIADPTADPEHQRWGIIEGNSLPFIDLHDFALEGAPANVAAHIWDLWNL